MEPMALQLTVRRWNTIDAQMDNSAFMARQNTVDFDEDAAEDEGDAESVQPFAPDALAMAIRQAGWDQIPDKDDKPDDAVVWVELARGQWEYVATELRQAEAGYEQLNDTASLAVVRDAANVVEQHLAQ